MLHVFGIAGWLGWQTWAAGAEPFVIRVADEATGRGVPLVELRTVNEVACWTDSAGVAAFAEPGLMDQTVFFHLRSHGYEFPKDGFGYRGKALKVTRGGRAELKIRRLNIAERLYRVTGEGIYRDSVLAGLPVPVKQPLLSGQVVGQDSVMAVPYRGQIHWFWGDTSRPSYPLGHFGTAGAVSDLPEQGGLDPSVGVDLNYFTDEKGFSRPMCAWPGPGMKWICGLLTVRDETGRERLVARCDTHKSLGEVLERSIILFNDQTRCFDRLALFDLKAPLYPEHHSFRVRSGGEDYFYFSSWAPQPCIRVKADLASLTNAAAYEAFTCLTRGSRYQKGATQVERDDAGQPLYAWKRDTSFLDHAEQRELVRAGTMKPGEGWLQMRDIMSDAPFEGHGGSVFWNEFRRRWVMIAQGRPGEIWFSEADSPVGPWVYARQIVTHDRYNFYNPTQHPFFDQDGGRLTYFEGTYTAEFSAATSKTPRYDYNQIMYRLDLADPRLSLPAPVYRLKNKEGATRYRMREVVEAEGAWEQIEEVAFFAVPPGRESGEMVAFYAAPGKGGDTLCRYPPAQWIGKLKPLFFAWPAEFHASTNQLDGRWDCTGTRPGNSTVSFILDLSLKGNVVTGLFDQTTFWRLAEIRGGSLDGTNLQLDVKGESDSRYAVVAQLGSNTFAGTYQQVGGEELGRVVGQRINLLPADAATPALTPLWPYGKGAAPALVFSTDAELKDAGLQRYEEPLCQVWRNPMKVLVLDRLAKPRKLPSAPARTPLQREAK